MVGIEKSHSRMLIENRNLAESRGRDVRAWQLSITVVCENASEQLSSCRSLLFSPLLSEPRDGVAERRPVAGSRDALRVGAAQSRRRERGGAQGGVLKLDRADVHRGAADPREAALVGGRHGDRGRR